MAPPRMSHRLTFPYRADSQFYDVLQHHVDIIIEPKQRACKLLVAFHHNPDARADALVDQF
jgi:hypothetical protein